MGKFERQQNKLMKLNAKSADGKIPYNKLVRKEAKVLRDMEKACPHQHTETEVINGETIEWCNDCTGRVS